MAPVSNEMDSYHPRQLAYERTTSVSTLNWAQEFESMNLPHFGRQFIQLVHTPLDVMHECLKLQLELQLPERPSPLSVKQVRKNARWRQCFSSSTVCIIIHVLMRDEKEVKKKQARSNKQQGKATQHIQGIHVHADLL